MRVLFLSLCLWGVFSTMQAQTYEEYVRQAFNSLSEDSLSHARELFLQAIAEEPGNKANSILYYHIGLIYEGEGKYPQALDAYSKGLKISPEVEKIRMRRASVYVQTKTYDKALSEYNYILNANATNEEALFLRAYVYTEQRLYKNARADYESILRINHYNEKANVGLVLLNEKDNRPREAMEQINALIATSPDKALYYAVRAGMEFERKQYEIAEMDYNKALSIEPENIDYLINRAIYYIETKRYKEARTDLEKALSCGASPDEVATLMNRMR